jgi:hypothetical protein
MFDYLEVPAQDVWAVSARNLELLFVKTGDLKRQTSLFVSTLLSCLHLLFLLVTDIPQKPRHFLSRFLALLFVIEVDGIFASCSVAYWVETGLCVYRECLLCVETLQHKSSP